MTQALFQYPEFLMAILLGLACLFLPKKSNQEQEHESVGAKVSAAGSFAYSVCSLLPASYQNWLARNQNQAGLRSRFAVCRFASWKVYPAMSTLLLALFLPLLVVPIAAAVMFTAADLWLVTKVARRRREISDNLPQALDLLLLCVDAGLGLDAALQRTANEHNALSNTLNDELNRLGRDILLGMDRDRAYSDLYTRTGVDELRSLGAALNQSQKLGLSVSAILRAQSEFIRQRQQRRAEERAAKLPVWMAFPLWFCIMPALMLVLIGPPLLLFIHQAHPLPPGLWH